MSVIVDGCLLDDRTTRQWTAIKNLAADDPILKGCRLYLTQGSQSSSVSASGSTHAGWGAFDVGLAGINPDGSDATDAQARRIETLARQVGGACWYRTELWVNGKRVWPRHVHFIGIGCAGLSDAAASQVTDYKAGRNGLANNGPDTGDRSYVNNTWESFYATHPYFLEDIMASLQDLVYVLRQEGVSGAGDAGHMLSHGYRDALYGEARKAGLDVAHGEGISGGGDPAHNGNADVVAMLSQLVERVTAIEQVLNPQDTPPSAEAPSAEAADGDSMPSH